MRAFWAMIVVVFIAAAVAMLRSGGATPTSGVGPEAAPSGRRSTGEAAERDAKAQPADGAPVTRPPEPRLERPLPREEVRPEAPALKLNDGRSAAIGETAGGGATRRATASREPETVGPSRSAAGMTTTDAVASEPAKPVVPQVAPANVEAAAPEPPKPATVEPAKPELPAPGVAVSAPAKPKAPPAEPVKPEPVKPEPAAPAPTHVPAVSDGSTKIEPTKSEPSKPEHGKAEAKGLESSSAPVLEAREDGSVMVDGKYAMRGKGTAEAPYQVTWDQLLSAQDEYVPREGRKKVPGRIMMLHGKVVEITGYIAFPLMADSSDELLSMMNQWDGCCIGVPPTPYDAVEVRLSKVVEGKERQTTFGVVRGTLRVEPHLVGGWLVGLYVMDGATLKAEAYNGFAP